MLENLTVDFKLDFGFRWDEDAKVHVGFCPALGLYSQGRTEEEAEAAVASAASLFIGACYDRDILHTVLRERGMTKVTNLAADVRTKHQYIKLRLMPGFDRVVNIPIPINISGSLHEHEPEVAICH